MAMAVRNNLELQQQRERGMMAVAESAKELSSRLDLSDLLNAIVVRAKGLSGSDLAWLTVIDAGIEHFRVVMIEGSIAQDTVKMSAPTAVGIAGIVKSTGLPYSTSDYLHDNRFRHDPLMDDMIRGEGVVSLLGVPLITDGEVIGLLFVADRYQRTHTALNVAILCTLGTHAAVAINNAKAFEQVRAALQRADVAHVELASQAQSIQGAADAHERLTALLATGASLGTLCQAIADFVQGSVLVVDEVSQVVSRATAAGYSGAAADAYSPRTTHSAAIAQALSQSRHDGRSVLAFEENGERCRVVAVIGGNDVLGRVLLFHTTELSEISIRTFERSSSIIGIMLLSQERIEAGMNRDVSSLVRALVSPMHDEPTLTRDRAERFGLDLSKSLSVLLVQAEQPRLGFVTRRLRTATSLAGLVFDDVDDVLVIICGTTMAQQVQKEFTSFAKGEFGETFRGVLSRPVQAAADIPALYASLRRALQVLERIGVQGQIVAQSEMALYSVLFETHDSQSLDAFLNANIGAIVSYDQQRGADLTGSLLCYFNNSQNAKATAAKLGIHVNTIRQRLATIEELLGHWCNSSRALEIHVALRLWSLTAKASRSAAGP